MTEAIDLDDLSVERAISRRNLFLGAGAAALAASAVTSFGDTASASRLLPQAVLGSPVGGLTYLPIDALDFFPDGFYNGGADPRYNDPSTGVGIAFTGTHTAGELAASIPLPTGSVIRQINVSYQFSGSMIINVYAKTLLTPQTPAQFISQTLANPGGSGPKTQTFNLDSSTPALAPITINPATTYTLRFYVGPGDTLNGVTIGYTPPTQGFVAATGNPRVLDTRTAAGKLEVGEERTVVVGSIGARSALFNIAVVETEGAGTNLGGFVACFPANIAYPLNSSINWFGPNQILSNSVLSAVDANGAIKIRGGANKTHVVIDRIGDFY